MTLFESIARHERRVAVVDVRSRTTYGGLRVAADRVAAALLAGRGTLEEERVGILAVPGVRFVAALLGAWRAGGVAVPLALSHPPAEHAHVLDDAGVAHVLVDAANAARLAPLAAERGIRSLHMEEAAAGDVPAARRSWPRLAEEGRALVLYTSGTTGKSKGAVHTHGSLAAQVASLSEAWEWSADDAIPNVLPLHHTHGLVNVTLCALANGACVEMLAGFDAEACWRRLEEGGLTLFMAVPTVYAKLAAAWDAADRATRTRRSVACRRLRLMVSGSAALPVPLFARWEEISGHRLLERYGMTEIGMALSNPLRGERVPGTVGAPLPGVGVALVDESGEECADGVPGELRVSGPALFCEYHGRPEETARSFAGGRFLTGDVAVRERGSFRILGRASMDILKSGGYKLSALEIEEALRLHPAIRDVAVVGLPDEEWGERVAAAIVAEGEPPDLDELRAWARGHLAPYKVPSRLVVVSELPRNAMGKVTKPAVKTLLGIGANRR
ncbi:MAG: acyl-CoA synthetase [Holophagales bacterium]|nr:acyl-CoA synthetase [Holophagales bacterium]